MLYVFVCPVGSVDFNIFLERFITEPYKNLGRAIDKESRTTSFYYKHGKDCSYILSEIEEKHALDLQLTRILKTLDLLYSSVADPKTFIHLNIVFYDELCDTYRFDNNNLVIISQTYENNPIFALEYPLVKSWPKINFNGLEYIAVDLLDLKTE